MWSGQLPGERSDIFFCQYDFASHRCPVQRLTSSAFDQTNPDIEGTRVVWEDDRNGPIQIAGLDLPDLAGLADREVQEGDLLRVPIESTAPPGSAPLKLSAQLDDGSPVSNLGARFRDRGNNRGVLRWRPAFDQAGRYRIRVRATGAGRLYAERSFQVDVTDRNRPPRLRTPRRRLGRWGHPITLRACRSRDPEREPLHFEWRDHSGTLLGQDCRLRLESPRYPGWQSLEVRVGDGTHTRSATVRVLWLPRFLWRWIDSLPT